MGNKILKYPIIEIIVGILWLYPFNNFLNTFLLKISYDISIFFLLLPTRITQNYSDEFYESARAIGITGIFLGYIVCFLIKIIILVYAIKLIKRLKANNQQDT